MSTLKQLEANRRNAQLSTGPTSSSGKAVSRMNRLDTGIDAQSQIIPGEDPAALELLITQYYDRFCPQGPEEVALIDSAISSDWLLRRLRNVEAEIWNRSISREVENQKKWGHKPEKHPMAAAFLDQQKAFDRLQRRISSTERSLRASLETLARLRKQIASEAVRPAILSPANPLDPSHPHPVGPVPPATPSEQTSIPEIGFAPEIFLAPSPEPLAGPPATDPSPDSPLPGSPPSCSFS